MSSDGLVQEAVRLTWNSTGTNAYSMWNPPTNVELLRMIEVLQAQLEMLRLEFQKHNDITEKS